MSRFSYIIILLSIGGIILVVISCSPRLRYKVLTKLFDGVPEQELNQKDSLMAEGSASRKNPGIHWGQEDVEVRQVQLPDGQWAAVMGPKKGEISTAQNESSATAEVDRVLYKSTHPPYKEKECNSCHNAGEMGSFQRSQPELCTSCHEDLQEKLEFDHGPAISGHCTACHSPHRSQRGTLLLASGKELCLNCHENSAIGKNRVHAKIADKECTQCHNPHKSDTRFLLQAGLCSNCHVDFQKKKYAYEHGPVGGEYCGKCHGSHLSDTKSLLVKADQQLCLQCHESAAIRSNPEHEKIEGQNCTVCHNPHGSDDRFLLR